MGVSAVDCGVRRKRISMSVSDVLGWKYLFEWQMGWSSRCWGPSLKPKTCDWSAHRPYNHLETQGGGREEALNELWQIPSGLVKKKKSKELRGNWRGWIRRGQTGCAGWERKKQVKEKVTKANYWGTVNWEQKYIQRPSTVDYNNHGRGTVNKMTTS